MRQIKRYGLMLLLSCIAVDILLSSVNTNIFAQAAIEEEGILKEVLPEAARFEPVKSGENILYYKAYGADGVFFGAAFKVSQKGYSSVIETMAGMKKDGTITAIKILSHNETPGLGAGVTEPAFTGQFRNRNIQELDGVEAVTGATVSSKAVIDSVKKRAEEVIVLIKNTK